MLVVDRVELAVVDQVADIGRLDHRHAVVLEQRRDAGDEAVGVRHVRQDVVGVDDVGPAALGDQLAASSRPKNACSVSMPLSRAASTGPGAGSMPSTGMPAA